MKTFSRFALLLLFACGAFAQSAAPFVPNASSTVNLAVTASAQTATLPTGPSPASGIAQYLITVSGSQVIFLRCDGVTPTVNNAVPFLPNSQVLISLPTATTTCQGIAAATGSTAYFTRGQGS